VSLVTVVNGVVCWKRGCDEKLRIENTHVAMYDVVGGHRIQMMNRDPLMNIVTFDAKITAIVSDDDMIANITPLSRNVELLIDVSIETEGRLADCAAESQVLEAILEGLDATEFGVRSNPRTHLIPLPEDCRSKTS